MLQTIICRSPSRTKGRFALATPISASSSRSSFVESVRSNCPLLGRMATWTFGVGTTGILHYCSDGSPSSPESHSKSFVTNDFQPSHSHLMAEAPKFLERAYWYTEILLRYSSARNQMPRRWSSNPTASAAISHFDILHIGHASTISLLTFCSPPD